MWLSFRPVVKSSPSGVIRGVWNIFLLLNLISIILTVVEADSDTCSAPPTTNTNTMAQERERSFIMVKPDGVQRGLVGEIIKRFEQKGFKLVAMKFTWASEDLLKKHYADLSSRPFFGGLVKYMSSGPVVPMVWEGLNVVKTGRQILGETDPAKSLPGTIRGDFCIEVGRNIIHGSDGVESAKKEINLWFKPEELIKWKSNEDPWLYE